MYRNILLQNHDHILDPKDKIQYKFWYRSVGALGMISMATFPYIVYLTIRLKKVKNFSNKLAISTMVQFGTLMMLIQAGKNFEVNEKKYVEKYLSNLGIDELKSFDANKYAQEKYQRDTSQGF
jgi:hypothetical protein